MKRWLFTLSFRIVVLTLMFAFATSGFAHRFLSPSDDLNVQIATTMGYNPGDICGGGDGEQAVQTGCEACLLASGFSLPPADFTFALAVSLSAIVQLPAENTAIIAAQADSVHPARAPPVI